MKKICLLLFAVVFTAVACNGTPKLRQDSILEIKEHKYSVQIADTPEERALGLSGIPAISDGEGMLFLFSEPQKLQFWMKGMLFPIDIIWINGNKIVDITENVQPQINTPEISLPTYSPSQDADKVLEVKGGWAIKHDIRIGDTFTLNNP